MRDTCVKVRDGGATVYALKCVIVGKGVNVTPVETSGHHCGDMKGFSIHVFLVSIHAWLLSQKFVSRDL